MTKSEIASLATYRDRALVQGKCALFVDQEPDSYQPEMVVLSQRKSHADESNRDAKITLDLLEDYLQRSSKKRLLYNKALRIIHTMRQGFSMPETADILGMKRKTLYKTLERLRENILVYKWH